MRFHVTFWPNTDALNATVGASGDSMANYARESEEAGILISQGMFGPTATELSLINGEFSATEPKADAVGYAYIEAASHSDAVKHVEEFLQVAGGGRTLIRELVDQSGA